MTLLDGSYFSLNNVVMVLSLQEQCVQKDSQAIQRKSGIKNSSIKKDGTIV